MPTSLLLVEDDLRLRHDLREHFLNRGFQVQDCATGTQALEQVQRRTFDLVLLDIMLPGIDGLSLLDQLRREQAVPVMLMSALGAEQDRISGFTRGADDYLPKPFSLAELDARSDALLRRAAYGRETAREAQGSGLQFDHQGQDVLHHGRAAGLTASEFRLLVTLSAHPGEALSKAFLYQTVLYRAYTRLDRGLDVHVCNLRRKLADIGAQHLQIQAVRSQGYVLLDAGHD
ncbi:response regulator transcription factor [Pseudomonas cremoricolorata]|uniref:response regulator transcription factor n=1 Tax=Pseudomonas cremoricolorata TaxID=157783 RepID=UPI0003F76D5E|nr:response regulator transcription factor [Pseudomonas cremoricolorata]